MADPEVEDLLYNLHTSSNVSPNYAISWPYRSGDSSVLAAVVSNCIDTLQSRFETILDISRSIHIFTALSLKVSIPLLIRTLGNLGLTDLRENEGDNLRQARTSIIEALEIPRISFGQVISRRFILTSAGDWTILDSRSLEDWWLALRLYVQRSGWR